MSVWMIVWLRWGIKIIMNWLRKKADNLMSQFWSPIRFKKWCYLISSVRLIHHLYFNANEYLFDLNTIRDTSLSHSLSGKGKTHLAKHFIACENLILRIYHSFTRISKMRAYSECHHKTSQIVKYAIHSNCRTF